MSHRGADEMVWALSEREGKEIWAARIAPAYSQSWPQSKEGPSCTPTIDGDQLYVMGLAGNVACLQAADGKVVWQRNLRTDFGGQVPMWSYRESPLVDGDKVICTPGGPDALLVALNKSTGETIWKSPPPTAAAAGGGGPRRGFGGRGGGAAYSSPIVIDVDGQRQYVQLTAKALVGVAASDGKSLWSYNPPANGNG